MKTTLPQDISDFADVATKRFARLGGVPAALRAETDTETGNAIRHSARAACNELGAFDLDVRTASDDALAAAVLCQAAGAAALPYPLVEELLAIDGARLALVNPEAPRIDHGDLPGDWIAADVDGNRYHPRPASRTNAKLGPFLVPATLSAPDGTVPAADVNLHLVLGSWRILGAMQQSLQIVTSTCAPGSSSASRWRISRRQVRPSRTRPSRCADLMNSPSTPSPAEIDSAQVRSRTHWCFGSRPPTQHAWCYEPLTSCSARSAFVTSPTSACSTGTPNR